MSARQLVTRRPAETGTAALGTGGLAAAIATHNWLAVGTSTIGYVPALTTYLDTHGGIRGVLRGLWRGEPEKENP